MSADFEWVEAVDGREVSASRYFELCAPSLKRRKLLLSPSELGCALSHMVAYDRFLASDARVALFLEDDVQGTEADLVRIAQLTSELKGQFFLACGGQNGLRSRRWLVGERLLDACETEYFRLHPHVYGQLWRTCCYAMTRGVAESMLARQRASLFKADAWEELLNEFRGAGYYTDILAHPSDLSSSGIESERLILEMNATGQHRNPRISRFLSLYAKRKIYRSILLSQLSRLGRNRAIH
jgi:glycosyl transferase, family 25